ncbi:UDP-N-acetylmuramoyl-tripeptide--D-alanyl-D-alanine ligase [Candidatus Filomicrobium marinum]|uniref:UDP-N-acetylmuramoyl-tripeptide--D-alanyl-D- alanine ligase n=1 Tax=Candidatus Filomicrobium marinum TaxID=1608628 RepID=UPI001FCDBBC2|nr:UDP-N-acetylmuramoyl-tripeptide--D-alanyl-D-alanine ligase [Candidatus Filomicrobium marinum]
MAKSEGYRVEVDVRNERGPLWDWDALVLAAGGELDGTPEKDVFGFSLDSREISPGDVFVALKDKRDGHDFVSKAFAAGAAGAIVETQYQRKAGDGPLIRVADTLVALENIGRAARSRLAPEARVVAVTGSSGKTTTKDMLRAAFGRLGVTHAGDKSFNNHWGVPLTLARMPADTRFGVFEIGMSHGGEITPLTKLVRPHVAIVLNVLPAHLGNFVSEEEIADAKGEIFAGLEPDGVAILNQDNLHFERLRTRAQSSASRILTFGDAEGEPDAALIDCGRRARDGMEGQRILAEFPSSDTVTYQIALAGRHIAENSLAALLAVDALGGDVASAAKGLAELPALHGRGERTLLSLSRGNILLIDESYNANPASMAAAITTAGQARSDEHGRLVLVLGDMLELGDKAEELHRGLKEIIDAAKADLVFACGSNMAALYYDLPADMQGQWAATSDGLREPLLETLQAGDIVMVKGSNGSAMVPLVGALKQHHATVADDV